MTRCTVTPESLARELGEGRELQLVDARSGKDAHARYLAEHLVGAQHVDLDRDLSGDATNPASGGRHPLPSPEEFAELRSRCGWRADRPIVVYDADTGANAAARLTWMLRSIGWRDVRMLTQAFGSLSPDLRREAGASPTRARTPSEPRAYRGISTLDDVRAGAPCLVDARDTARFEGRHEPIDPVAGSIPGAVSVPFRTLIDAHGSLHSAPVLRAALHSRLGERDMEGTTVYCGSGVTACVVLVAMDAAGLHDLGEPGCASLYVGGWSEWCRRFPPVESTGR